MTLTELDLTANLLVLEEIIERFEELQEEEKALTEQGECDHVDYVRDWSDLDEYMTLKSLLSDLEGMGGDIKWDGKWYPHTLIKDSFFKEYAIDLAHDIGSVKDDAEWPHTCIDWERAAEELKYDYSAVDVCGATYWTR